MLINERFVLEIFLTVKYTHTHKHIHIFSYLSYTLDCDVDEIDAAISRASVPILLNIHLTSRPSVQLEYFYRDGKSVVERCFEMCIATMSARIPTCNVACGTSAVRCVAMAQRHRGEKSSMRGMYSACFSVPMCLCTMFVVYVQNDYNSAKRLRFRLSFFFLYIRTV